MPFGQDTSTALRHVLPLSSQEQIGLLMNDGRFITWLKSPSSQFLVVHDEKSLHSNSSLSTLSYLCGLMSTTLQTSGMWPISFFCGLHTARESTLQSGKGIIRGLALQLLLLFGDTAFPVTSDPAIIAQRLMADDLDALCAVFAMLLGNMLPGVVYCLIDGAHWYDTEGRRDDTRAAMRFLGGLVMQLQNSARGLAL